MTFKKQQFLRIFCYLVIEFKEFFAYFPKLALTMSFATKTVLMKGYDSDLLFNSPCNIIVI